MRNPRILLAFGVLLCAAWLPFYQAVLGEFLEWDDDINITENPNIQGLDGRRLLWMFGNADYAMRYKPLSWLVWAITYQLCGLRPAGFHAVNLLLHAVNAGMLFLVLAKLLREIAGRSGADCRPWRVEIAAGVGALLWAWHPLRVEPVAWITGMPYGLALFFLLLSWLLYMQHVSNSKMGGWKYFAGAVASFSFAVLAYPVGVAFVAVLVALDYAVFRRLPVDMKLWLTHDARRVCIEKLAFVLIGVAALAPTLVGRMKLEGTTMYEGPIQLSDFGVFPRVMQGFYVWAYYLWKPLIPTELAAVYATFIWFDPASAAFILSAIFIVGLTVAVAVSHRNYPGALALWLAYLAVTVPVLGLTERPHYPSDRYGHLPNIVWAIAISIGLFRVWPKRGMRAAGVAVSIFAAGLCALMSFWQTAIWKDSISLLEATLESLGSSNYRGDIASRLGSLHSKAGNLQRAGECFEIFRVTGWKSEWAHVDAATFWLQQNRLDLAQFHADEALTRSPKSFAANEVKANVLAKEGRFTEAVSFYQAALKAEPNNGKTHSNLGVAFANLNRHDEAVAALRSAVQCEPLNWANHFNLAIALEAKGEIFVAITSYRRAIEIRPDLIDAQRRLAELYLKKDEPKEAVAVLRDGIRRLPNSVPLLEALASLLATHPDGNVRNGAESVALASEAVRLTAEASPQPLNALAAAFAAQGQFSDAVKTQERALSLMETSKQETVVAEMRHRLALYRTNQPFRASPAPQRSNPAGIK